MSIVEDHAQHGNAGERMEQSANATATEKIGRRTIPKRRGTTTAHAYGTGAGVHHSRKF
jgi:hypothetical protein